MRVSATKPQRSNTRLSGASRFHAIHATTKIVNHTMNLGVPRKRAIASAHSPSRSLLARGRRTSNCLRSPLGRSNPRSAMFASRRSLLIEVLPPVARQQVVKDVVNRDGAAQLMAGVHNRYRED